MHFDFNASHKTSKPAQCGTVSVSEIGLSLRCLLFLPVALHAVSNYRDMRSALMGYLAEYGANGITTFGNNLSVPQSRVKNLVFLVLQDGTDRLAPEGR